MRFLGKLKQDWQLHAMILLPLIWLVIFAYIPMAGVQIAFRRYEISLGMWQSEWIGLANFERFFTNIHSVRVIWNTLRISVYTLVAGFPVPIILALLINSIPFRKLSKTVQMVTYAPHFISTVVMVSLLIQFLHPHFGIYGQIARFFGVENPTNLLARAAYFDHVFVWSGIWQSAGFGAIIYIAALAGVDPTMYEAATIDGATKLQKIRYIDIPSIMPTAVILLILNMGSIMNVGFERIFLMQNPLNTGVSEVISTFVYKIGIGAGFPDYSLATAVGLFNSVISCFLVVTANYIARRMGDNSLW